jgi:hypothetical protein
MKRILVMAVLWPLLVPQIGAQVASPETSSLKMAKLEVEIVNPKHLNLPNDTVKVLMSTACQVVAEDSHLKDECDAPYSLKLVLGAQEERYGIDPQGRAIVYLSRWDDSRFAYTVVQLAMQRAHPGRLQRLVAETLHRSSRVAPISANDLRGANIRGQSRSGVDTGRCNPAVTSAACSDLSLRYFQQMGQLPPVQKR